MNRSNEHRASLVCSINHDITSKTRMTRAAARITQQQETTYNRINLNITTTTTTNLISIILIIKFDKFTKKKSVITDMACNVLFLLINNYI